MAQSAENWRNMHTHMHSHAYINTVTTTWCEAPGQLLVFSARWVFSCFSNPPIYLFLYISGQAVGVFLRVLLFAPPPSGTFKIIIRFQILFCYS